ncbi:TetR/AcrR family transcriptional regulator [Rhodopseudomonas sp. HC1]|uniref:TetR/AcrR family transcriptional regulator n=1 Tax=Rhodopseudomonas infernalis TaxID=2897386 RepID=UPI001EE98AA3|nr:TetR/AcrR family transcriptional regulator [Rhodopseudomonas infernalis]MCG6204458.1 TetR/AcrR family transcriptional regulator [Rhodopseudomonas infernalis]
MTAASTTADEILACARGLIIAGGYNGFSYADIADAVGIRKPSIHHHFPTKAELVQKLVAQYRKDAAAGLAHLAREAPDPATQLRRYTGYWAACIKDGSAPFCVCALLATELPVLPEQVAAEVRAHFRSLSAWLKSALERGQKDGSLTLTETPRAEAELFMATVHGAMLSARAYGEPKMFATITNPLIDRLCGR